jgi:hypothetical protein
MTTAATRLDPRAPRACPLFVDGLALLAAGEAFVAHERFEALWHAEGRSGDVALLLKVLVRICAAHVKAERGAPAGVRAHAAAVVEQCAALRASTGTSVCAGIDLDALAALAARVHDDADALSATTSTGWRFPGRVELVADLPSR